MSDDTVVLTPEEKREQPAFLKWWEGSANWTGSPCAVAFAGWMASAHGLRVAHAEASLKIEQQALELAALARDLDVQRERSRGLERELAEARTKAEFWERDSMNAHTSANRLGDQRDDARRENAELRYVAALGAYARAALAGKS